MKIRAILATALALLLLLSLGCNNNRAMTPEEPPASALDADSTETPVDYVSADDSLDTADDPPPADTIDGGAEARGRVAELDERMRTAPPDSIPALEAEYERLVDSLGESARQRRTNEPGIETGPVQTAAAPPPSSTPEGFDPSNEAKNPIGSFKGLSAAELASAGRSVKSQARTSGREAPARQVPERPGETSRPAFRGLSQREIRSMTTPSSSPAGRSNSSTNDRSRREASARLRREMERRYAPTSGPKESRSRSTGPTSTDRAYIDGVAAARAGKYDEAIDKLGGVVNTGTPDQRNRARYYYGRSLEGSGRLREAADQYARVARGNDALAHAALVDQCRLLGRLGQSARARTMILNFLRRHPDSSQVAEARQLLQTL